MYAVSLVSFFDNELKMIVIESDSIINAILDGTKKILGSDSDWVDDLRRKTESDIKEYYFNCDMLVCAIKIKESNGKVR